MSVRVRPRLMDDKLRSAARYGTLEEILQARARSGDEAAAEELTVIDTIKRLSIWQCAFLSKAHKAYGQMYGRPELVVKHCVRRIIKEMDPIMAVHILGPTRYGLPLPEGLYKDTTKLRRELHTKLYSAGKSLNL